MTFFARHISVAIQCPAAKVYDFASDPRNLPQWASGLGSSVEKGGGDWVVQSPVGELKIRFAEKNPFGILDHDVTLPSGQVFPNPMRVVANGDGSELSFTLFRQPDMSEKAFEDDAATIAKDLSALKILLEKERD